MYQTGSEQRIFFTVFFHRYINTNEFDSHSDSVSLTEASILLMSNTYKKNNNLELTNNLIIYIFFIY